MTLQDYGRALALSVLLVGLYFLASGEVVFIYQGF